MRGCLSDSTYCGSNGKCGSNGRCECSNGYFGNACKLTKADMD